MIRAALQSSHFLYRLELTAADGRPPAMVPLSQYELATRLSYLLWASGPDDALLDAAGRGELGTKAAVATKARDDAGRSEGARSAITDFYNQWMGTSRLDDHHQERRRCSRPTRRRRARRRCRPRPPAFVQYVLWTGDHKLQHAAHLAGRVRHRGRWRRSTA